MIIHNNKTKWGNVWHIITNDGSGHIQASIENDDLETIYLSGLSVIPEKRNKGIGKLLIKKAEEIGLKHNKKYSQLNIEKPTNWILDFYIKLNYKYLTEDTELIFLVKNLQ